MKGGDLVMQDLNEQEKQMLDFIVSRSNNCSSNYSTFSANNIPENLLEMQDDLVDSLIIKGYLLNNRQADVTTGGYCVFFSDKTINIYKK